MSHNPFDHDEVESLLAARQELGPGMEPALVDSFAEKIIAEVQRQTAVERQMMARGQQAGPQPGAGGQLALGIVSLVMSIPLTAMAFGNSLPWMAVVIWVGIVLVNYAYAVGRRPSP